MMPRFGGISYSASSEVWSHCSRPVYSPSTPLTVSFFTKGSEEKGKGLKNALTYGAFILGLTCSSAFPSICWARSPHFYEISTNPWLNVFFFVIFLVFAVSFFGYFEMHLAE